MSIKLRPETVGVIQQRVESGQFEDADAVVAAGLDLMQQKEKYEELEAAIDVGYQQFLQGEVVQLADGFFERVLDGARERSRRGVPVSNDVKP